MIAKIRFKKGWSQRRLSKESGVSQAHISRLEKNDSEISPTVRSLVLISKALNIDSSILLKYYEKREIELINKKFEK